MTGVATADLMDQARAGDGEAFRRLTGPHRRELQVHCYRMLGSVQDAEDALQETLLAAWRGLDGFEGRASLRTWLYQVATSRCLNLLRAARRRPGPAPYDPGVDIPEPTRLGEVTWLQPYPDELLAGLADRDPGPEARYERREAISLAFVTALQLLPPRQRAVLILRDVLGFRASETADMLETTQESVTSALKRARATLAAQDPGGPVGPAPAGAGLRCRARAHRAVHPGVRGRRRRPRGRIAVRRRAAGHAAGAAGVLRPGPGRPVPGGDRVPAGPVVPAAPGPGQRPARVRGLPARPAQRDQRTPTAWWC